MKDLEKDLRKVMSPNTATKLKEHKRNVLKDFVHVAGPLGVTHFLLLSATQNASYLRIGKTPRGPTVTLRIHEYSLMRDVLSSLQRPRCPQSMWTSHPLVVMNSFNEAKPEDAEHMKLISVMFQNLFPSINVMTTKLNTCQRVLLLEYDKETRRISLRHYSIAIKPAGVARNLKKLLDRRQEMPDMSKMRDIAEFMTKSGYGSESEGEDAEVGRVEIADTDKKGSIRGSRQSRVKLSEIGPRMEMEVIKVEEGLCDGKVLYHRFERRTKEEVEAKDYEIERKRKEKDKRRREQEENVRKKQLLQKMKEEAKKKKSEAKNPSRKRDSWWEKEDMKQPGEDVDDDVEWYKQEVGQMPDEEFQAASMKKKKKGRASEGQKPQFKKSKKSK